MTDGIRQTIRTMTGSEPARCPWRAFASPLVREVMHAQRFFEHGNLSLAYPEPSHRLMEGIGLWNQVYNRVQSKQLELECEERKRAAPAPSHGLGGIGRGR